jgi:hypothetical protein
MKRIDFAEDGSIIGNYGIAPSLPIKITPLGDMRFVALLGRSISKSVHNMPRKPKGATHYEICSEPLIYRDQDDHTSNAYEFEGVVVKFYRIEIGDLNVDLSDRSRAEGKV